MTARKSTGTPILSSEGTIGAVDDWMDAVRIGSDARPQTIRSYSGAVRRFADWLAAEGIAPEVEAVEAGHVIRWLAGLREQGLKSASLRIYWTALRLFFAWSVKAGMVDESPVDATDRPKSTVPEKPVLSEEQIDALIAAATGTRKFEDRRNLAMVRLLLDTGMRRGELENMDVEDVTLDHEDPRNRHTARIRVSKTRPRVVRFSPETAVAIGRYLSLRPKRKGSKSTDALLIGPYGRLGGETIRLTLRRLGKRAGIPSLHPHILRHTWTSNALEEMSEGDVMYLGGWTDRRMLDRYGASRKADRALDAARRRWES